MTKLAVVWSDEAKRTSKEIADHIFEQWGRKPAIEFADKVRHLVELLSANKQLCPRSRKNKNLRRCTLTKQTSLVYEVRKKDIYLVTFLDNRSDYQY